MRQSLTIATVLAAFATCAVAAEQTWQEEYAARLKKEVDCCFVRATAPKFAAWLRVVTAANVVVSPESAPGVREVTLSPRKEPIESIISGACKQLGLEWGLLDHAVYMCLPGGLERAKKPALTTEGTLTQEDTARLDTELDVSFVSTTFSDTVRFMVKEHGLRIYFDLDCARKTADQPLDLVLTGMPLKEVLGWFARQTTTQVTYQNGAFYFRLPDEPVPLVILETKRISCEFNDTPLSEALANLSLQTGIKITLDREQVPEDRRVSLALTNTSLARALKYVCEVVGLAYRMRGDQEVVVTTPDAVFQSLPRVLRLHDIVDVIAPEPRPTAEELVEEIRRSVRVEWWGQDGLTISVRKGLLIVTAPDEVHREIERYLNGLRSWRRHVETQNRSQ